MYILDDVIINKYKDTDVELSFFNTEPLSITYNLELLQKYMVTYPFLKIYDYSFSNFKICFKHNIQSTILEYLFNESENILLKNLNLNILFAVVVIDG